MNVVILRSDLLRSELGRQPHLVVCCQAMARGPGPSLSSSASWAVVQGDMPPSHKVIMRIRCGNEYKGTRQNASAQQVLFFSPFSFNFGFCCFGWLIFLSLGFKLKFLACRNNNEVTPSDSVNNTHFPVVKVPEWHSFSLHLSPYQPRAIHSSALPTSPWLHF